MADFVQLPIPATAGDQVASDDIAGLKYQRIKMVIGADGANDGDISAANPLPVDIGTIPLPANAATETTLSDIDTKLGGTLTVSTGLSQPLTDAQLRASAVPISDGGGSITVDGTFWQATQPVSLASSPLPTGAATEVTLDAINDKLPTADVDQPTMDTPSLPVRQAPQKYTDCSYSQVGSGLLAPELVQIGSTGSGMAVNQSAGNLVITTGTTVNAEIVLRSVDTFSGALTLKEATTLSQRIANNNFYIELVDIIGDGLAYNIVNTTTVDVTKTAHGYTAANVGQRMDICALSSVGVPMEAVIASIPNANTIRFTVAGYPASGSGTCSLTGWNKVELLYTGTTATVVAFNSRRKGWQNTAVNATINTTASGHITSVNVDNGVASLGDKTLAAGNVLTNRTSWDTNIPRPDEPLYLQIRAKNGTTAPASTTTWTQGMWRVEDFVATQVDIVGTRQQSISSSLPVFVAGSQGALAVSGTLTSAGTTTNTPVTPTTTFTNSAATTNGTVIKGSAGTLWNITASNINAAVRYLKIYNSATVTVGTTTPILTIAIPAGGSINIAGGSNGLRFATGICLGITTGSADGDTGAVAANEIKVATTFT